MKTFLLVCFACLLVFKVDAAKENCTGKTDADLKLPACTIDMKVNWWQVAPYIYEREVDIRGLLKTIVEKLVRECCGACVNFHYSSPANDSEKLKNQIGVNGSVLSFPIYGDLTSLKFKSVPYFPVIQAPGVVYIQAPPPEGNSAAAVIDAVFQGWPILVLTLVMASLSGIIMWGLDSYWNPEEFPSSFFKGSWEGFWWAFVSMTTVGYGDRAPRSFIARVFAFFWVLVGLVIISIFTATVTTSLTALSLSNDITLYGTNVVALKNTEEQRYGVRKNAKVKTVGTVDEFADALLADYSEDPDNAILGGLIDSYVAGHYEEGTLSPKSGIRLGEVFDYTYAYGFVISNTLNSQNMQRCLRKALNTYESEITDKIQKDIKAYSLPAVSAAEEKSGDLFDPGSSVFQLAVFTCLGIILILSICSLLWEYLYWRPKIKREQPKDAIGKRILTPHTTFEELVTAQCRDLEDSMITQVKTFYKDFHAKLSEIRQRHTLQSGPPNAQVMSLNEEHNESSSV